MYLPKLDWYYFNTMFSNRIIEGLETGSESTDIEYPINIKSDYVTETNKECSAKCSFSFKYPTGNLTLKNSSTYLELTYDKGKTAPVIFNGEKYDVHKIYILNTPIHYFDGIGGNGEILIYHTSLEGAIPLIVAIPLSENAPRTNGSASLENVISIASEQTAGNTDTVTLNTNSFTLNDYLPKTGTEFYSYQGTNCIGSSNFSSENVHYIVYHKNHGINLETGSITKLNIIDSSKLISLTAPTPNANDDDVSDIKEKMFINKYGASEFEGDDDIYIDCSPTGDDDDEVAFKLDANSMTGGVTAQKYEFMLTVITRFAICIIVILGIWYAPYYVTDLMNGGDIMRAFEDMTFGGPMDELIDLQKQVKKMNQQKIELFSSTVSDNKWTAINQAELDNLLKTLKKKQEETKQFKGNAAGLPFSEKGFFAEARDKGVGMREDREKQRTKSGKELSGFSKKINEAKVGNETAKIADNMSKGVGSLGSSIKQKTIGTSPKPPVFD